MSSYLLRISTTENMCYFQDTGITQNCLFPCLRLYPLNQYCVVRSFVPTKIKIFSIGNILELLFWRKQKFQILNQIKQISRINEDFSDVSRMRRRLIGLFKPFHASIDSFWYNKILMQGSQDITSQLQIV